MRIVFLDDGNIKLEADPVSAANHASAENVLKEVSKALGATIETTHKHGKKMHSHTHSQTHHHKH
jgi:hypothetical protein